MKIQKHIETSLKPVFKVWVRDEQYNFITLDLPQTDLNAALDSSGLTPPYILITDATSGKRLVNALAFPCLGTEEGVALDYRFKVDRLSVDFFRLFVSIYGTLEDFNKAAHILAGWTAEQFTDGDKLAQTGLIEDLEQLDGIIKSGGYSIDDGRDERDIARDYLENLDISLTGLYEYIDLDALGGRLVRDGDDGGDFYEIDGRRVYVRINS